MDTNQRALLLNWTYNSYQEKSMDELRQSLAVAMELEEFRVMAQREIETRDLEIATLKALLSRALKEKDDAQQSCQKARLEIALLQKQLHDQKRRRLSLSATHSGVSGVEDVDPTVKIDRSLNNGLSSSDCDESVGSSQAEMPLAPSKPLLEKGRLLQAVMKAGPLLQTLLIAGGPLPEWRHPPPPLNSFQIPPPAVDGQDRGRISSRSAH